MHILGVVVVGVAIRPFYRVQVCIAEVSWGTKIWPLYGIAKWPLFRGCLIIEV